jgi:hypothetical protein
MACGFADVVFADGTEYASEECFGGFFLFKHINQFMPVFGAILIFKNKLFDLDVACGI